MSTFFPRSILSLNTEILVSRNMTVRSLRRVLKSSCADFNLDFYTEVQDLSYLENALSKASPRFAALNMAVCSLIEDFGLVGFETLAVEVRSLIAANFNDLMRIHAGQELDVASYASYRSSNWVCLRTLAGRRASRRH